MDGMQSAPQFELPKPQDIQGESSAKLGHEGFGHLTPELQVAPMPGEKLVQANQAVSQAISTVPAIPFQQQAVVVQDDAQSTSSSIADDNDVIEKEWVDKAKTIVARTQGDPHAKTNELTGLKKEYIQKRYGKIIALPNDETSRA